MKMTKKEYDELIDLITIFGLKAEEFGRTDSAYDDKAEDEAFEKIENFLKRSLTNK